MDKGGRGNKEGGAVMNRDEGQYHLSHVFDEFLSGEKQSGNPKIAAGKNSVDADRN